MREAVVEAYLRRRVEAMGGLCLKWVSPGNAGVPDRLVILPGGRVMAIELKAPGQKLRSLQQHWQERLAAVGLPCGWASSQAGVDALLAALAAGGQR